MTRSTPCKRLSLNDAARRHYARKTLSNAVSYANSTTPKTLATIAANTKRVENAVITLKECRNTAICESDGHYQLAYAFTSAMHIAIGFVNTATMDSKKQQTYLRICDALGRIDMYISNHLQRN